MRTDLPQGDLRLLETAQARELLNAALYARLGVVWTDGTPRVIPTWFHWTGTDVVMPTFVAGPKAGVRHPARRLAALRASPDVAISIGTDGVPPLALSIRGRAVVHEVDGLADEYVLCAERYLGEEAAAALVDSMRQPGTRQARIVVRPSWAGLLDFRTRFPSPLGGVG
ncbi:pyridoxamine 5'-phosphate oxidase family protein [Nonomuraea sp. NPDC050783]|uniref:pyridoxamine 5'-phosphate oxidase family protein n=1 Tax=Nonomuraea sp. NPDC050783 TaxID=3154634 RepID=UPI003466FC05